MAITDIAADTDSTGTSIDRATRSAVRCRVPVSVVGIVDLGIRWTLARAIREASGARMMAPSILASSERRWGLNSASTRKPPVQIDSTSGPSPTTTKPPRLACRIRSSPSRSGRPGAAIARASSRAELWRALTTSAGYRSAELVVPVEVLTWTVVRFDGKGGNRTQDRRHPYEFEPGGPAGVDGGTKTWVNPSR